MNNYQIPDLFALGEIESKAVLKACSAAHQALGELKGVIEYSISDSTRFTRYSYSVSFPIYK